MLELSTKSDYGLLLLSILAKNNSGKKVSISKLTKEAGLPYAYLGRIAGLLAQKGILKSKEGINGGYQLARSPEKIKISEVLEILEGPITITKCNYQTCDFESFCPMQDKWKGFLKTKIIGLLHNYSLKDLIS